MIFSQNSIIIRDSHLMENNTDTQLKIKSIKIKYKRWIYQIWRRVFSEEGETMTI